MTEKQIARVRTRIDKIKRELAADRRRHGGYYDDSRGLRYLPPELYLRIRDYAGAKRYFNWFHKNFPDDGGYPEFLFEWALTLYKCKKMVDAENKVLETFFANTYLLSHFLRSQGHGRDIEYGSNWETEEILQDFAYSCEEEEWKDFADWLSAFMKTERYIGYTDRFLEIKEELKDRPSGERRSALVREMFDMRSEVTGESQ